MAGTTLESTHDRSGRKVRRGFVVSHARQANVVELGTNDEVHIVGDQWTTYRDGGEVPFSHRYKPASP